LSDHQDMIGGALFLIIFTRLQIYLNLLFFDLDWGNLLVGEPGTAGSLSMAD